MKKIILLIATCLYLSSCGEEYYIREANRYYEFGQLKKAIECFDKALAKNPGNYNVHIDKGIMYSEMNKEEEAIKTFSEAIALLPQGKYAYNCRAESYMRIKKYKEALEDYNSALKIVIGNEKGLIQMEGGVYNDFFHTKFSDPDDKIDPYSLFADRAVAYYYLDSIKPAWIDLNFCISKSKELAQCHYWRAFVYFKINKTRDACDDLKKAASLGYSEALDYYKKYCDCDTIK